MARPTPLSGFPEWLPAQRIAEQQVLDRLRRTFELWGFASVETRAVEPLEQMLRKGEIDKEVYVLRRLHADPGSADSDLGLHFDLTVPFARYVLENAGHLHFPFKRYQIQRCWRGERPQEGRYREFTQADVDVVGDGSLAFHHDVEVAAVMVEALGGLGLPPLTVQVNNRKLIEGFYRGIGAPDPGAVMRAVDKLDKMRPAAVRELLAEAGLDAQQADRCLGLAAISSTDLSFVDDVRALGVSDELLDVGLAELAAVIEGAAGIGGPQVSVVADLRIARGLDYYTGTVYETRMAGFEHIGSVCSGGRYDALASDGARVFPGVGISFGVTRALAPLFTRELVSASRPSPSCVLVAVVAEETRAVSDAVAAALRARGIPCEVAPAADKFGKQIRYAERRGIPYVWFPGASGPAGSGDSTGDEVKDIRSGDQVAADATTWNPPPDDLHPTVTHA
jgi:histidyl-tRNA synthetase